MSLAAVIVISCFVLSAFAGDKTTVEYKSDSTWTAVIPDTIKAQDASEDVNSAAYTVKAQNIMLGDGESLVGTIEYSGNLTDGNVNLPYSIYNSEGSVVNSGSRIIKQIAGDPTAEASFSFGVKLNEKAKYSGNYLGTATFNFSVAEKTYTLDEINADEHLYAIGKNKAEWVVAKFNDDYSNVTVLANGEDSDGIMKDYQTFHPYYDANATDSGSGLDRSGKFKLKEAGMQNADVLNSIGEASPMAKHGMTLNTAIIKSGVKNIGAGAFALYDYSEAVNWDRDYQKTLCEKYSHEDGTMGLRHISIADTVEKIGDCAFLDNTGLRCNKYSTTPTSIVIPSSVKTIGKLAFTVCLPGCTVFVGLNDKAGANIYELYLPITFNEGLETIDELAFAVAGNVATPKGKISDISNINASQFNTSLPVSLKDIKAGAFSSTSVIGNITLSGNVGAYAFSTSNFSGDGHMSADEPISNSLSNVTVSGNVGEYAFAGHFNIDTINLLDGCTSVGEGAFTSYRTLNIGKNLKDIVCSYTEYMENLHPARHARIAGSFSNFSGDLYHGEGNQYLGGTLTPKEFAVRCKEINVSTDNPYYTSVDGVLFNKDVTKLLIYPAGKTSTSKYGYAVPKTVKEITTYSFEHTSLDSILLPSSVIAIAGKGLGADKLPQTIYGVSGSYAQTWANNNNLQFVDCQDAYRGPQTVTVSYDSNGGKGYMPSYTVTTKEPFNKMEFTLALRTPFTKDGYEFAGWAFRNNVTGEYLKNGGQIITIPAADLEQMAAEVGDTYTFPEDEGNFLGYDGSCNSYSVVAQWTAK